MPAPGTDARAATLALLWAQRGDAGARSLCDVRLGPDLAAHSFVLAAASPVLAASFATHLPSPHLAKASPHVLHALLGLAYGVAAPARVLTIPDLLELAALSSAVAMPRAFAAADTLLAASVTPAVALAVARAAGPLALPRATAACRALLKRQLPAITAGPEWSTLDANRVAAALRLHDLAPRDEVAVFRALEAWIAHEPAGRKADAPALLRLVRFPTLSDRALLCVARSPHFAGVDEFYQLLLEAFIRRAEVRLVHGPAAATSTPTDGSPAWRLAAVTDGSLGELAEGEGLNARDQRSVRFEGLFPLRWYKGVRFRTRSPSALLFTFVVPGWSKCRKRVRSDSRAFADHRWSLWVDPFAAAAAAAAGEKGAPRGNGDADYISLFLCCEAETTGAPVRVKADYALFIASSTDPFGMERKVCAGRTFRADGQAMGFRRHTRRSRLAEAGFYDAQRDELVVGAHVVLPGFPDAGVERPDADVLELSKIASASRRSSQSTQGSSLTWPAVPAATGPVSDDPLRDLPDAAVLNPVLSTPAGQMFLAAEAAMVRQGGSSSAAKADVEELLLRGASSVSVKEADEGGRAGASGAV